MVEVSKRDSTLIKSIVDILLFLIITVFCIIKSIIKAVLSTQRRQRLKKLNGEIVLITGGAGGIGRLVAVRLAKLQAIIVLWDVDTKGVEEAVELVKKEGGRVYGYTCDLTKRAEVYQVAAKVSHDVGQVTILINNAGVASGSLLLDTPDYLIQRTFDVNILSHFWTTKAFLPKMIENDHGHIVTIASLAGLVGVHKLVDYCSSKFAAVGFDESLRLELEKLGVKGVKTTVVCPYFIQQTGMFNDVVSRFLSTLKSSEVAEKIVDAIQREKLCVIIPGRLKLVYFKWLLPWEVISMFMRNVVLNPAPGNSEADSSVYALINKRKKMMSLENDKNNLNIQSEINYRVNADKKMNIT